MEWITDRKPTKKDAYKESVWLCRKSGYVDDVRYGSVILGEPWMPITPPEPYVIGDSAEADANAALIAAAHELLEALQVILDEDMEDTKRAAYLGGFVLPDDLRQQARAAIAKAKGEML